MHLIFIVFIAASQLSFAEGPSCTYGQNSGCGENEECIQTENNKATCRKKFLNDMKRITYPFSAETPAVCDQGALSPRGNSHSWINSAYAVDLKGPALLNNKIHAGAEGKVIAHDQCSTENDQCGAGFGNHVKILTDDDFIVFYAHLKTVLVKTGDHVRVGEKIGTEGNTGWTGQNNKHLHFSVHAGWKAEGINYWQGLGYLPSSVPFIIQSCRGRSDQVTELKCKRVSDNPTILCPQ